jgi:predicted permease
MSTRRTDEDFSAEISAHLDLEIARLVADGRSPADARAEALRSFGNVARVQERYYEANRWMWLEQMVQDLRYGLRGLRKSPAFVATTVLTLAVALSLLTVVFTIFNAYVLRPFAVRDPGALHRIVWLAHDDGGSQFRWRDYEALRERRDLFEAAVAEDTRLVASEGRTLSADFVSENYFETLAPRLLLGRALGAVDARAPVAVLSQQAWTRLFAGDPGVLGRDLDLDGRKFTIVGVLRQEFAGLDDYPKDLWIPLLTYAELVRPDILGANQSRRLEVTVRLRAGVTAAQAEAALTPMMPSLIDPKPDRRLGAEAQSAKAADLRAEVRPHATPNPLSLDLLAVLSPVFAAFVLVLVTACANVSNVMLSRAIARQREIAVRLSLGASRGRVVRQLLTEGLLIAVLAGVVGLALAAWTLRLGTVMLFKTLPPSLAALLRVAPLLFDYRVFAFALTVAAGATLLFALVPALRASRLTLTDALHGDRTGSSGGSRLRSTLVVAQVAVSLVLVVVALTLARNGVSMNRIDLGFQAQGVISINIRGDEDSLVRPLAAALAADPRVAEVAVTGGNPGFERTRAVAAAPASGLPASGLPALGPSAAGRPATGTRFSFVSPEYFPILRIPIRQGRAFSAAEAAASARVAIVSAATATAFWPGADPIGQSIRIERPEGRPVSELPGYSEVTVVGVVPDVVSGLLFDGRDAGHIYLPTHPADPHAIALLMRPRSDRELGPAALQDIFRKAAPDPQVFEAIPLGEMRDAQLYPVRAAAWIGTILGAIALVLSVSGLYGVLSYTLTQRTREIGIRMALGATAAAIVRLLMGQSARLAGIGAAIGLAVAFSALKVLSSAIQLSEVSVLDGAAFAGGVALVAAATAFAAYYPARRATRVDPAVTLRADA